MNAQITRNRDTTFLRNTHYKRVLFLEQFLLTISWSLERTALVMRTLNDSEEDTVSMTNFALIRVLWESCIVLGGWAFGLLVMKAHMTPVAVLKLASRMSLGCTPILFYVHIEDLSPWPISLVYASFMFLDGGIRNMRNVLLTQCSPRREMMYTLSINLALMSLAVMLGSGMSMMFFRILSEPILPIHLTAASFYVLSMLTLQLLGDAECAPEDDTKSFNPVKQEHVPYYLLGVFMLLPATYCVSNFYEIWAIREYDVAPVVLDTSKFVLNFIMVCLSLAFAFMRRLWPSRRWITVGTQTAGLISLVFLAYLPALAVYTFFALIIMFVTSVFVSRLIVSAMFYDNLPSDSPSLTKWASISLFSSLLTRCAALGMSKLIDEHGLSTGLSVVIAVGVALLSICICVARVLNNDLSPTIL